MMRRLMIAVPVIVVAAAAGVAGWHYLRPHDPLAESRALLAKGDARAAQLVLRNAVQADPGRAETHLRLGQLELRLGDPASAEREFRAAAAHGTDAKALAPLLAGAVVAQQRNEEVLRDYTPDGLSPDQAANVLVARAQAQLGLGKPQDAAASVAQARRLVPQSAALALASGRVALASDDIAAAQTDLAESLALDPHSLDALTMQAELRARQGDQAGALASYTAALAEAGTAAPGVADRIRLSRAVLLTTAGDTARARADVDAVLKSQPKQPLAQFLSARLYAQAGEWKAADAALATIGPLLGKLPGGDMALAAVKANLGEPEQAMSAAERQVGRTPADLTAVKLLARLQMRQRRPELAADTLSATTAPLDSEALEILGDANAANHRYGPAVAALQKASALRPDDRRLLTKLAALQMENSDPTRAAASLETPAKPGPVKADAPPTEAQSAGRQVLASLQAGELDQAATALDRLRGAHGDPAQIATLDGMIKLAGVDLAGAREAFEEAIRLNPTSWAAQLDLARVLAMQDHSDDAIDRLQRVLAANPNNTQVLTALTNLQLSAGRLADAVATGETAQKANPDDPALVVGLSSLYLQTGHADKALALLDAKPPGDAGTSLAPTRLALRAQAQLALGRRDDAAATLHRLLEQTPDDVALRSQLAGLLTIDKHYDAARNLLRDGLALRPGDLTLLASDVAAAVAESGIPAGVARAQVLAADPANGVAVMLPGDLLMRQGKFAEAAAAYQGLLATLPKDDPRREALVMRLAGATASAGDPSKAAGQLRDWLTAHPDNPEMNLALASLDIGADRLQQARASLEALLANHPDEARALNNLAWIAQAQGDLPLAEKLAGRAYLLGSMPQTADTLGWIMLAKGRTADAIALLREAAKGRPNDPGIQYHLAAALARDGQTQAAKALLKTAMDLPAVGGFQEKPQAAKLLADLAAP